MYQRRKQLNTKRRKRERVKQLGKEKKRKYDGPQTISRSSPLINHLKKADLNSNSDPKHSKEALIKKKIQVRKKRNKKYK